MHQVAQAVAVALLVGLSAGIAAAESTGGAQPPATSVAPGTTSPSAASVPAPGRDAAKPEWFDEVYAVDVVGKDVVDASGKEIANVDDIVARTETGQLFAVVSVGGFFGIGAKEVAVPLDQFSREPADENVVLAAMSEQQLAAMADYDDAGYEPVSRYQKLGALKK